MLCALGNGFEDAAFGETGLYFCLQLLYPLMPRSPLVVIVKSAVTCWTGYVLYCTDEAQYG